MTAGNVSIGYEPYDTRILPRRYEMYAQLLEHAPVHRTDSGYWTVARYDDVRSVLDNTDDFSSLATQTEAMGLVPDELDPAGMQSLMALAGDLPIDAGELLGTRTIVAADPPQHTRLRRLVNRAFTPRRINAAVEHIDATIDEYVAAVDWSKPFDLVSSLAVPFPVRIICDLLGVHPDHHGDVRRWSDTQQDNQFGNERGSVESVAAMIGMWKQVTEFFLPILEQRRANPGDDIISDLTRGEANGALTPVESVLFIYSLLAAGNESTANLLGNVVVELLRSPEQLALLRDRPELIPNAVEEAVRIRSPFQYIFRETTRDVEVAGQLIPAGDKVMVLVAAANRDPRVFADPDKFDVTRNTGQHIGFGRGIHFCIGAALARAEGAAFLRGVLPHLPNLRLAQDPPELQNMFAAGYSRIDLIPV